MLRNHCDKFESIDEGRIDTSTLMSMNADGPREDYAITELVFCPSTAAMARTTVTCLTNTLDLLVTNPIVLAELNLWRTQASKVIGILYYETMVNVTWEVGCLNRICASVVVREKRSYNEMTSL